MKNIHILPTDKPSSIGYDGVKNLHFVNDFIDDYQNIYITSDEEIKTGEWCFELHNGDSKATSPKFIDEQRNIWWLRKANANDIAGCPTTKKIILTTDLDLSKDGVQAIDDDFLEWFFKNPSCEEVEVDEKTPDEIEIELNIHGHDIGLTNTEFDEWLKNGGQLYKIIIPKEEPKQCDICKMAPRLEGTNKCESCYSVVRNFLEQDPRFKDNLLPDLRKEQETSSVGAENQIFKIVLDEKWRPNKVSMIETDNNSVLNKQETLEEITEQIQKDCHKFVESIISKVTYQDATNTFLFMKLAELTLKLKKYE